MKVFYEKADEKILKESENFVEFNKEIKGDNFVCRESLDLFIKLSRSLMDSQKDFDAAIKIESDKIDTLEDGPSKDCAIARFNQANYVLILDKEAHDVLKKLLLIGIENRRK